jgi:ABC-type multidrug transport system permease subunit
MRIVNDVCNESRLCYYQARRYWPESLAAFTATLCVFAGFLYAVTALGDVSIDSGKLDGLIVGFTLWFFASTAYSSISAETSEEIRQRTLEQICIAPTPLWAILGTRAILKITAGVCVLLLMLAIVNVITGGRLNINYATMIGAVLLATPSLVGLGYMMSGLLLVVRKGETLQMLVYPALIALVAYPAHPMNMAAALPFAYGASVAKLAASGHDLPWTSYLAVGVISLLWLYAGLIVFRWLELRAKRLGVMGHL